MAGGAGTLPGCPGQTGRKGPVTETSQHSCTLPSTGKPSETALPPRVPWKSSSNMDGLGGHYAKWNMSDRYKYERQILLWYHLYVESKTYTKLVNITEKKQTHRYREQTSGYQWGEGKEEGNLMYSMVIIVNNTLLYSHWEWILSVLTTHTHKMVIMWGDGYINELHCGIISQCVYLLNHHTVHLKIKNK